MGSDLFQNQRVEIKSANASMVDDDVAQAVISSVGLNPNRGSRRSSAVSSPANFACTPCSSQTSS